MVFRQRAGLFLRCYVASADTLCALAGLLVAVLVVPSRVSNAFVHDILGLGVQVLSIVFAVFFAAMAIIVSTSDDDFVDYLEQEGIYSAQSRIHRHCMGALLVALFYSAVAYATTAYWQSLNSQAQPRWLTVVFVPLFTYALVAASQSAHDALKYPLRRVSYLRWRRDNERERLKPPN